MKSPNQGKPVSGIKPAPKFNEVTQVQNLRRMNALPENALIGKVVHCETNRGWGLICLMGTGAPISKKEERIYYHVLDLGADVPEQRLFHEQIVTFSIDTNHKRGPRAVKVRVLYDLLEGKRTGHAVLPRPSENKIRPRPTKPSSADSSGLCYVLKAELNALAESVNAWSLSRAEKIPDHVPVEWACRHCRRRFTRSPAYLRLGRGCPSCAAAANAIPLQKAA